MVILHIDAIELSYVSTIAKSKHLQTKICIISLQIAFHIYFPLYYS